MGGFGFRVGLMGWGLIDRFGGGRYLGATGWRRSSAVEQENHNLLVGGSNPSAATIFSTGYDPLAGELFTRDPLRYSLRVSGVFSFPSLLTVW